MPAEWQNGEIDGTTWHELLRSFIGVKTLHICGGLSKELSRALQVSEIGSDPGLLPDLQELASGIAELYVDSLFGSFIHARRVAGRPIRSSSSSSPSSSSSSSSSSSNFQTIFGAALNAYKEKTGIDPLTHPLAAQLQSCNSPSNVLAVLRDQANKLDQSRTHDGGLLNRLKPTINVLCAFSATLGEGVSVVPVFSPAKVIFTSVGVLLLTAKGVYASHEALIDLFDHIARFFRRLEPFTEEPFTEMPPTAAMTDIIVKIMVELLNISAIATKEVKRKRARIFFRKLLGRSDIEDALEKLDIGIYDVARMAHAGLAAASGKTSHVSER
ncbi:hypothetical protein EDB84DRAFT_1466190 [Lactarius hengduanensis]|nr:hypothetical protein EDB84DRAFT_1466190 [Lactarius hengduanensis]